MSDRALFEYLTGAPDPETRDTVDDVIALLEAAHRQWVYSGVIDRQAMEAPGATYVHLNYSRSRIYDFKVAETWEPCIVCGEATRARVEVWSYVGDGPTVPRHVRCKTVTVGRPVQESSRTMNRHDRKRCGIPRPPRDPMYEDDDDFDDDVNTPA